MNIDWKHPGMPLVLVPVSLETSVCYDFGATTRGSITWAIVREVQRPQGPLQYVNTADGDGYRSVAKARRPRFEPVEAVALSLD